MEAVNFMVEITRMCKKYTKLRCQGCPLVGSGCDFVIEPDNPECIEKIAWVISTVEQWSKTNPRKTRLTAFLEAFPNAPIINGLPPIDPCRIDVAYKKSHCDSDSCGVECREKYWNEVIE